MSYTKGEWSVCQDGKCSCKMVWSENHPIAKVESGEWGDKFCSIRLVGSSSIALKCEPFMDKVVYGEISEKTAIANAHLIAAAPDMYEALKLIVRGYKVGKPNENNIKSSIEKALAKAGGKDAGKSI